MTRIKIDIRISEVVEGQLLPVSASTCLIDDFGVAVAIECDSQGDDRESGDLGF